MRERHLQESRGHRLIESSNALNLLNFVLNLVNDLVETARIHFNLTPPFKRAGNNICICSGVQRNRIKLKYLKLANSCTHIICIFN